MEMGLRLEDGEKTLMLKTNIANIVEKILLFILLKIAFQLIIKLMDFMQIINQDKLLFGLITGHMIIKLILI